LGGGGARGYAHIGVIEVLLEHGYEIAAVSGSSMGALVGGMHAAGTLPAFTEWALTLTRPQVMRLLRPSGASSGPFTADKVLNRMSEMVGSTQIENLAVPFTAVATDLHARKPVWFQQGSLEFAIRASIAIPGFFTPVLLDGRVLVDGGVIDPVPMTPLASARSDLTVAVTLGGDRAEPSADVARSVRSTSGRSVSRGDTRAQSVDLKALEIVSRSYEAMSDVITRYRLAGYPADITVAVPQDACGMLDFHRTADMIALGRQIAEATLETAGRG
jgi:NTE family protein